MVQITTVKRAFTYETDKIKGSRFIGDIAPVDTPEAALAFVETIRNREPTATHHCWAFVLHDGNERSSDDGEPSGTGGPPILRHLKGAELVNVACVITRYYGGTKLGTGGLIRAYGGTTAEVLEHCPINVTTVTGTVTATFDYALSGVMDGVINQFEGKIVEQDYGVAITLSVAVPIKQVAALQEAMFNAASANITFKT